MFSSRETGEPLLFPFVNPQTSRKWCERLFEATEEVNVLINFRSLTAKLDAFANSRSDALYEEENAEFVIINIMRFVNYYVYIYSNINFEF